MLALVLSILQQVFDFCLQWFIISMGLGGLQVMVDEIYTIDEIQGLDHILRDALFAKKFYIVKHSYRLGLYVS